MLLLTQMLFRLLISMAIGAIVGVERELIGKEAGIRTSMLVAGGAAIFAMIGMNLPYLVGQPGGAETLARSTGGMNAVANIVLGIGFLGAGIIFRDKDRVHGLTTAAVVWATAALGVMAGIGLWQFALVACVVMSLVLFVLRKFSLKRLPDRE